MAKFTFVEEPTKIAIQGRNNRKTREIFSHTQTTPKKDDDYYCDGREYAGCNNSRALDQNECFPTRPLALGSRNSRGSEPPTPLQRWLGRHHPHNNNIILSIIIIVQLLIVSLTGRFMRARKNSKKINEKNMKSKATIYLFQDFEGVFDGIVLNALEKKLKLRVLFS